MPYISPLVAESFRGGAKVAFFWRLDTSPPTRIVAGVNDVPAGIESIDAAGTIYRGGGRFMGLPDLDVLLNGVAEAVEWFLRGVPEMYLDALSDGLPDTDMLEARLGMAPLDERYQPTTPIIPIWFGLADKNTIELQGASLGEPMLTVKVRTVGGDAARSSPTLVSWTDNQQRALSPTDAFCSRTNRYWQGHEVAWPRG